MSYLSKLIAKKAENRQNIISLNSDSEIRRTKGILLSYEESDLGEIHGVGEETQKILFENGIYSQEDLRKNENKIDKINIPFFGKRGILKFLNK